MFTVISRIGIILVGVLLSYSALSLVRKDLDARQILFIADQLDRGGVPKEEYIQQLEDFPKAGQLACRRDIQNAATKLSMALLDNKRSSAAPGSELAIAYENALAATDRNLACYPFNGDAWMRRSMARLLMEGPVNGVVEDAEASQLTMPREGYLLRNRIGLLVALGRTGSERVKNLLNRDLDTLFVFAPLSLIRKIHSALGDYGQSILRNRYETASSVIVERRDPKRHKQITALMRTDREDKELRQGFLAPRHVYQ